MKVKRKKPTIHKWESYYDAQRNDADPLFRILLSTAVAQSGLLETPPGKQMLDANRILLESMTPAEARVAKRKFRKAWRSAAKARISAVAHCGPKRRAFVATSVERDVGLGVKQPSRNQKRGRKSTVYTALRTAALAARDKLLEGQS